MTTTTHPDFPLPAGAYVLTDWDESSNVDANKYRVITTRIEEVEGTATGISVTAVQLPDGSLINEGRDRPTVRVDRRCENPNFAWDEGLDLTSAGARQLARALLEAADQLDGWAGTGS